jgi:hypothetical protein
VSEPRCICGHTREAHGPVVVGASTACSLCRCELFCGQRSTTETKVASAAAPLPDPHFGVPSALRHPLALSEAALSAAFDALIELRLLIAAVDDVILAPAPRVEASMSDDGHVEALQRMVEHRTAITRLGVSQKNARAAVERLDVLRRTTQPPPPAPETQPCLEDDGS